MVLDFGDGVFGGEAVEIEDADGGAAGGGAADRHLGDVDLVVAENRADRADDAGHVVVGEDQQVAVQIGFQAKVARRISRGMLLPNSVPATANGLPRSAVTSAVMEELKAPMSLRDSSVSLIPRSRRSSFRVDDVDLFLQRPLQRPAQKAAVRSLVFLLVTSPR